MRIGVDLGGTKVEAVALDAGGEVLVRRRTPTPRGDYEATVAAIARLVSEIESELNRQGSVGIGIPGAESPATEIIKNANSVWLIGQPFAQDLSAALDRPVRLTNDANCFTLSEAIDGAAAGKRVVFGVILGTGVGGGIAIDGRILVGANAIAGEWGHNPLPWPGDDERPGPQCYCGKLGCIETYLSGPGLARDHHSVAGDNVAPDEIALRAAAGIRAAENTLTRYENRLARSLATVINVIDPDAIVLGGGLSNFQRLYHHVPDLWGRFVFSDRVDTPLLQAKHGDSSGVRGAAWLWPENEVPSTPSGTTARLRQACRGS